jgi:HTH-type transcriptional regulator, sugar sensing transcriptional regulator
MIVQNDFIKKLKSFGLNSYEAKIWTALLSRGVSTAGELSDIANVPRSRSYDILESLEKKGFIVLKLGKPIKYLAVPPQEVVERLKKRISEETRSQMGLLDELRESPVLDQLTQLHKTGIELVDPNDVGGAVKGKDNIYNQMDLMVKDAQESITLMTTASGLVNKASYFKNAFKNAHKRGVSIKIITQLTKESKVAIAELAPFCEIKALDKIKARFMIVDGKELVFMLMDDAEVHPTYDIGIWVNTPFFAGALTYLFDLVWKEMKQTAK